MVFQTDPAHSVPGAPKIHTEFCDGSEDDKPFNNTGYARIIAQKEVAELIQRGRDVSIKNTPPHVTLVHYEVDGTTPTHERFTCVCHLERELQEVVGV